MIEFLHPTPIDGGSLNTYDYAGQDPVNGYDLSGLLTLCNPDYCRPGGTHDRRVIYTATTTPRQQETITVQITSTPLSGGKTEVKSTTTFATPKITQAFTSDRIELPQPIKLSPRKASLVEGLSG
jgi:hypothetical protein